MHTCNQYPNTNNCITRNDALDTVEEIIEYIDIKVPYPNIAADSIISESVIRDFFSKFCYFIKVKLKESPDE